ncbi:MAG: TRM11 family SAM-dependent methyltransferase [Candidatus Ratteibacteria bacterium]
MKKENIEREIIEEKIRGIPDIEIGKKYKVSYKFIENVLRKFSGIALSEIKEKIEIKKLHPDKFHIEKTTLWSFKNRGKWATHSGEYRGNWSPYIPRNIILRYSKLGETVLDPFCGSGTTCIEAKILGRKCIGIDINEKAIILTKKKINFKTEEIFPIYEPEIRVGDARNLYFIKNNSIDLICTHPPYADAIKYTEKKEGDLSWLEVDEFILEMKKVAKEFYRVLKPGKKCVFLIGDLRKKKNIIPLGFELIDIFQKEGFILKDLIIKKQHNCKTTGFWYEKSLRYNFLLLAHEYLPIFEKPVFSEDYKNTIEAVKEVSTNYKTDFEFKLKNKLPFLEVSTVWIFSKKEFEERLNKNIIKRYSPENMYSVFYIYINGEKFSIIEKLNKKDVQLLFFKIFNKSEIFSIGEFLNFISDNIFKNISRIRKKGYIVFQTKDIKLKKELVSIGKEIVMLFKEKFPFLKLKEIIIVAFSEEIENNSNNSDFKIVHDYLIVFEKNEET